MSSKIVGNIFFAIVIGLSVYYSVKKILNAEKENKIDHTTYQSLLASQFLPLGFLAGIILTIIESGIKNGIFECMQMCINLIVTLTLYYTLMLIILRGLRNKLHPLMVSTLWTIPNFLNFVVLYRWDFMADSIYYLTIDLKLAYLLFGIWMLGFALIMIFKIIEHFYYRKEILKDSIDITDESILNVYNIETDRIKYNRNYLNLKKSKNIQSPLTIGVRNKVIVLPNKYYTDEELHLIFRHELVHVARVDIMTKLLLVFSNAFCWFNPLMWFANKKCSEDLELSCDLSVLSHENENIRKKYANLILKTATSEKGFTTCLSTSAKVLQYRLKNIMSVSKKSLGLIVVFVLTLFVSVSWGNVGIVIKGYNGYEDLFDSKKVELIDVSPTNYPKYEYYIIKDGQEIIDYFSNLELYRMSFDLPDSSINSLSLYVKDESNEYGIGLYDNYIRFSNQYYLVKDEIDWDLIYQNVIHLPSLTLNLYQHGVDLNKKSTAILEKIETNNSILYETETYQYYDYINYYPSHILLEVKDNVTKIEVTETTKNGINQYMLSKDSNYIIETNKQDVEYQVKISYEIEKQIYDITYKFDFNYVEGISLDEMILDKK